MISPNVVVNVLAKRSLSLCRVLLKYELMSAIATTVCIVRVKLHVLKSEKLSFKSADVAAE